jgi:predicted RNA methylase
MHCVPGRGSPADPPPLSKIHTEIPPGRLRLWVRQAGRYCGAWDGWAVLPASEEGEIVIYQADILHWAEAYQGELMHAVLTDPPYGLNESELDIEAVLADWMAGKEHQPKGAGFMGRDWDAFLPGPSIWRAIRRCCAPGAFLFAFGGTRTADLLALALRLAGWEKRDEIDWIYSTGFPKNQNISKAIDRAAKADRPIIGTKKHQPKFDAKGFEYRKKDNGYNSKNRASFDVTGHATELAQTWDGYGTALKPAHEPVLVFRNPLRGTYAQNCTATGAGVLNIDGGRVAGNMDGTWGSKQASSIGYGGTEPNDYRTQQHPDGRWPANLLLSHAPTCNGLCAPGCPVAALGVQSGGSESKASMRGEMNTGCLAGIVETGPTPKSGTNSQRGYNDTGTAARFFHQSDYMYERLEAADPVIYTAKASRGEREAGLDPRQLALLGLLEQGESTINDGRDKSIDNPYQRGETARRNIHPCLKPIALTRYLATLLLPPTAYAPRRLLVPFSGAGSEMCGAMLAGWEDVIGVELEAAHVEIARARLAYWKQRLHEFGDPAKEVRATLADAPAGQMELF